MKKFLIFLIVIAICFTSYIIGYNSTTQTTNLELVKIAEGDLIFDWFDTMNDNLDLIDAVFDTVSLAEFAFLDGVTSNIQDQLDAGAGGAGASELSDLSDVNTSTPTDKFVLVADGVDFESRALVESDISNLGTATALIADKLSVFAATTSAELAGVISDETGGGALVFGTSPTLVTPILGVATATSYDGIDAANILDKSATEVISGAYTFESLLQLSRTHDTPSNSPTLRFRKQRDGNPTLDVSENDYLGETEYFGYSGEYIFGASIIVKVDGTPGEDDMPSRMEFSVSPDGSAAPALQMVIKSTGNIGMGGITTPTAKLHLPAGTATAGTAPLKLTAGTLLTTPELGVFEYVDNGTTGYLYFTLNVAGTPTRIQIAPQL